VSFKFAFKYTIIITGSNTRRKTFQILGAATENARDAIAMLVLG